MRKDIAPINFEQEYFFLPKMILTMSYSVSYDFFELFASRKENIFSQ